MVDKAINKMFSVSLILPTLQAEDLVTVLGSQDIVTKVLDGELDIDRDRAKVLGNFFNSLLSFWDNLTNLRHFSQRKIKVLTDFDKRELMWILVYLLNKGDRFLF